MVKLRLARYGRKNNPIYRVVAADSRSPRDGKFIEIVGTFNVDKHEAKLDNEKIMKWLKVGAQPSDTVKSILSEQNIWKEFKQGK